jgi:hypothetical protein
MTNRKSRRTILVIGLIIAVSVASVMGGWYALEQIVIYAAVRAIARDAAAECTSKGVMTIPDLAGARVEVVYTKCYKTEESAQVYLSRASVKEGSWFAAWRSHRTLVLNYGSGDRSFADVPLPSITYPAASTILISVPKACELGYTSRKWENMSIVYEIASK